MSSFFATAPGDTFLSIVLHPPGSGSQAAAINVQTPPNVPSRSGLPHMHSQLEHRTSQRSSSPVGLAKWFGSDVLQQPLPSMPTKVISVDELEYRQWARQTSLPIWTCGTILAMMLIPHLYLWAFTLEHIVWRDPHTYHDLHYEVVNQSNGSLPTWSKYKGHNIINPWNLFFYKICEWSVGVF